MDTINYKDIISPMLFKIMIEIGDEIHLHNRNGIYTVSFIYPNGVEVNCKRWISLHKQPMFVEYENIKSFVVHNSKLKQDLAEQVSLNL